jgi:hypothetical protein
MGEAVAMRWDDAQKLARKLYKITVLPVRMGLDGLTQTERALSIRKAKRQRMER